MIKKVKRLSPTNLVSVWIFISVLSVAPVLVAAIQIQLTDWSAINPLLGHFVSPIASKYSNILLSIGFAILLGGEGYSAVFILSVALHT